MRTTKEEIDSELEKKFNNTPLIGTENDLDPEMKGTNHDTENIQSYMYYF